jgi:hypothetical protein
MATVASGLNSGSGFNSSDTITSTNLNLHVNDAEVTDIDNDDVAINAAIAFTKLAPITSQKVIGSIGSGNAEIDIVGTNGILKNDDALGTSDTQGATQGNIKAYVDAEIDKTIGHNQTWQSVTRALDSTEYTNDTGKPIMVNGRFDGSTDDHAVLISIKPSGGSYVEFMFAHSTNSGGNVASNGSTIIPVNSVYKFRKTGDTITSSQFHELR